MHSSYVVTDPKGTILLECGKMLQRGAPKVRAVLGKDGKALKDKRGNPVTEIVRRNGKVVFEPYEIKVLNTIDFSKSMHYNPFNYIRSEKDILKFTTALITNTKGEDSKSGEDFWVKAETLLYCALVGFIYYEAPDEEKNMNTLVELINSMEVQEENENFKNAVDIMFEKLEKGEPEKGIPPQPQHFAVRQYKKYKLAAGKTAKSILISCGARLAPFDIAELREIMSYDEMGLDTIGEKKTALFIIISDTDTTFNFIAALMYSQLFNLLCDRADNKHGGRLPIHVRFLLDEFANIAATRIAV
jgi:type IV secretion system protein VirD4